jgi:hypothetical protein
MAEILWHRRETRRQTEKTNFCLNDGKAPAYSPTTFSRFLSSRQIECLRKRGLSPIPLRLFLARLLLTLEDCRTTMAELVDAIGPLDQWVATDHDALLAE